MKLKFEVTGMTCAACSARVEKVTKAVAGVLDAQVNLMGGTMIVVSQADVKDAVIHAVENAGYGACVAGESKPVKAQSQNKLIGLIASAVFLLALMYFTMGHMVGLPVPGWYHGTENALVAALLQFFLTLPVVLLNQGYYTRGLKALWHRSPNMDTLIAVGSGAALVYGVAALLHGTWRLGNGAVLQ